MPRPMTNLQIAEMCHEANRLYSRAQQCVTSVKWQKLDGATHNGYAEAVDHVRRNPEITPEELHDRWCEVKTAEGWTPGGKMDRVAKVHPCLKAYDELNERERLKDVLFLAIVNTCLAPQRFRRAQKEEESRQEAASS